MGPIKTIPGDDIDATRIVVLFRLHSGEMRAFQPPPDNAAITGRAPRERDSVRIAETMARASMVVGVETSEGPLIPARATVRPPESIAPNALLKIMNPLAPQVDFVLTHSTIRDVPHPCRVCDEPNSPYEETCRLCHEPAPLPEKDATFKLHAPDGAAVMISLLPLDDFGGYVIRTRIWRDGVNAWTDISVTAPLKAERAVRRYNAAIVAAAEIALTRPAPPTAAFEIHRLGEGA